MNELPKDKVRQTKSNTKLFFLELASNHKSRIVKLAAVINQNLKTTFRYGFMVYSN